MAQIKEVKGNIFDSKCQVIVNTVNCKGFMGKGLALEFRYRYPDMFENYVLQCKNNQIKIGELTLWNKSTPNIINFPTKNDWKYPSRIEYVEKGLDFFINNFEKWNIQSIAFPRLGASQGGLNWIEVRKLMFEKLKNLNINIEIYEFSPHFTDKLFIDTINKLENFSLNDYISLIKLNQKEAKILREYVTANKIKSFLDIQNIPGFGEKSILKIYVFANSKIDSVQKKLF